MRELLHAGEAVLGGVERGLQQAQREGGEREHLPAPPHGLLLQALQRHDGVDEPHLERFRGVVLAAEEPDLLRLLGPHEVGEQPRAEAAVEGAHARPDLPEAGVLGGDREVAHEVQHVAAADRVPGDHRHHGLGQAADLDVQVGDVKAPRAGGVRITGGVLGEVAGVPAHALVAAGAERLRPLAGEHDHPDLEVLVGLRERARDLDHGQRPERVAHLGPVDRDLRDPPVGSLDFS